MKFLLKVIVFILFFLPTQLEAQILKISKYFDSKDSTQVHILETYRGDLFKGRVLALKDNTASLLTGGVLIDFKFGEIKSIKVEGKDRIRSLPYIPKYKGFEIDSLAPQFAFFHSTAFGLPKGMRLYNNVDLLWNSLDVNIGKGFSVGASALVPILMSVRTKYNYSFGKKLHVGVNFNLFGAFDLYGFEYLGTAAYLYGVTTFGTPKLYLNFRAGLVRPIFVDNNDFVEQANFISGFGFGGKIRNFVYQGEIMVYKERTFWGITQIRLLPSFALGWNARRSRYDLGVMVFPDYYSPVIIPYLSFKTHF